MTSAAAPPSCANCGVQRVSMSCTVCRDTPSYVSGMKATTFYCDIPCALGHKERHRIECKAAEDRRLLYRTCDTAKMIFQSCCQSFPKISIVGAEKIGNDMHIYQTSDMDKRALPSLVSIFPSADDKAAAMAYMASDAAIPFLRALLEHMLPCVKNDLARIDCTIKDPIRRIIMITPDGTSLDNTIQPHSILQVTLPNHETYAIDISGIQYGFPDDGIAVIPWDIYHHSRIQSIRQVELLLSLADERLEEERFAKEQAQIEDGQMEVDDDDAFSSSSEEEYSFTGPVIEAIESWQQTNDVLIGMWPWGAETEFLIRQEMLVEWVTCLVNGADRS